MRAVCMVSDYVEFHFDGPIVRAALSDPRGRFGEWGWHFLARDAPSAGQLNVCYLSWVVPGCNPGLPKGSFLVIRTEGRGCDDQPGEVCRYGP
jgi:hypothetical protein